MPTKKITHLRKQKYFLSEKWGHYYSFHIDLIPSSLVSLYANSWFNWIAVSLYRGAVINWIFSSSRGLEMWTISLVNKTKHFMSIMIYKFMIQYSSLLRLNCKPSSSAYKLWNSIMIVSLWIVFALYTATTANIIWIATVITVVLTQSFNNTLGCTPK